MKKICITLLGLLLLTGCDFMKDTEEKIAEASGTIAKSKNGIVEVRITLEYDGEKSVITKAIQYDNKNKTRKTVYTETEEGNYRELTSYTDVSESKPVNYAKIDGEWYTIEGELANYASPENINFLLEPASAFLYVKEGNEEKKMQWHQLEVSSNKIHQLVWDTFGIEDGKKLEEKNMNIDVLLDSKNKIISKVEFDCTELMDNTACKAEIIYDKIDIAGSIEIDNSIITNDNDTYQSKDVSDNIFDIINNSKNNVHALSAEGVLNAIRLDYTSQLLDNNPSYEIEYNFTIPNANANKLTIYGSKPIDGVIVIKDGEFTKVENLRFEGMTKACTYDYQTQEISC